MMLSDTDKQALERKFSLGMKDDVTLLLFVEDGSAISEELMDFAHTIAAFSPKIKLDVQKSEGGKNQKMKELRIERAPVMVLGKGDFNRIRYYGVPAGHEVASVTDAIAELSSARTPLSPKARASLASVRRKANIKVFVLPTCPFCPPVVRHACRAAIDSPKVTAEIIDAQVFADLAARHSVMGTPKMILNDNLDITGAVQEVEFFERLKDSDISLIDSMYG
ncbi:MAG: thioredoxin family protein [Thermoplasmata archaeon]